MTCHKIIATRNQIAFDTQILQGFSSQLRGTADRSLGCGQHARDGRLGEGNGAETVMWGKYTS
jgi:hypothetical protein